MKIKVNLFIIKIYFFVEKSLIKLNANKKLTIDEKNLKFGEDVAQLVRALAYAQRTWVRFLALANLVNFSL